MRASWVVAVAGAVVAVACALPGAPVSAQGGEGPELAADWGDDMVPLGPGERPLRREMGIRPRLAVGQVYDVHVFLVSTPTRPAPISEAEARNYLTQINAWYAGELGALAPVLRFAGGTQVAAPQEDYCGLVAAQDLIGMSTLNALAPTAGALDATWLIITPDVSEGVECQYGGQASLGGRGVWVRHTAKGVRSGWFLKSAVHEFGHNLGLTHSGLTYTRSGVSGWQADGADEIEAYGDQADPMGRAPIIWDATRRIWTYPMSHMHGHNRNLLGAMPPTAIAYAPRGVTTSVRLSPMTSDSGTRLLYVPLLNRSKFFVEYRPAAGLDATFPIDSYQLSPGPGVYVRMVNTQQDEGPDAYDPTGWGGSVGSVGWPAERWEVGSEAPSVRMGFRQGETATLPDGSTITVGALSAGAAQVTVTRPADNEAPAIAQDLLVQGCPTSLGEGATCTLTPAGSTMRLTMTLPRATDNQWLSSLVVAVDGQEIVRRVSPNPGILGKRNGLAEGVAREVVQVDMATGGHTISTTATDLAGRSVTRSATLNLIDNRLASAPVGLSWTWRSADSITLSWRAPATTGGRAVDRYWVERSDNAGLTWNRLGSTETTSAVVQNLPRGTSLRFRVAAQTAAGVGAWAMTNEVLLPALLPGPPRSVSAVAGDGAVTVSWAAPESDGGSPITGYTVTSSEGDTCTTSELQCDVEDLVNGVPYTFTVVATNEVGDSEPTEPTSEVTPVGAPSAVVGLRGDVTGRSLRVTWEPPDYDGGLPITDYRYRIGSGAWRTTADTAATVRIRASVRRVTVSVQAGNESGYGPTVTARIRVR